MLTGLSIFLYGLTAYTIFVATFLYAAAFVLNLAVPKSIDRGGIESPTTIAILINSSILALFAIQHMIMARPAFKRRWMRIIPQPAERSTFVLIASAILILLFRQWRPIAAILWDIQHPVARAALIALSLTGFAVALYSSFLIDHFDLFGLRQVWLHLRGRPYTQHPFSERSLYRVVRHPLMLGFLIGFWSTPTMTAGHLLFSALTTAYIFIGMKMEERDLIALHPDYLAYRRRTPMLLPLPKRPATPIPADATA